MRTVPALRPLFPHHRLLLLAVHMRADHFQPQLANAAARRHHQPVGVLPQLRLRAVDPTART